MELKRLLAIYRRALLEVISIANSWVYLGFDQCCFLGRESYISQVTLLVVPGHRGLSSPGRDSWESTTPQTQQSTNITTMVVPFAPPSAWDLWIRPIGRA